MRTDSSSTAVCGELSRPYTCMPSLTTNRHSINQHAFYKLFGWWSSSDLLRRYGLSAGEESLEAAAAQEQLCEALFGEGVQDDSDVEDFL